MTPRPPHAAEYVLRFDLPTDSYHGRMKVPGTKPVTAQGRGRREVLRLLDRAWLKENVPESTVEKSD